ncbi:MAG: DUF3047 domain-containing protein [Deltaproteobacteria bacterium]|nr:DUF3047 domain-containing protein [Deltaproteobacteria bacterium]
MSWLFKKIPCFFRKIKAGRSTYVSFFASVLFLLALLPQAWAETPEKDVFRVPITHKDDGADGWKLKEWKGKAKVSVVETEVGAAFHLKSDSTSTALYKEIKFDVSKYPVFNWSWKVTELPKGGDVRKKSSDDQAAQVYVVFPKWPSTVNSRIIGYIWDSTVPAGLTLQSTKSGNTKYVIVKGGPNGLGQWFNEKRNVYEDYKKLFKEEPPKVGSVSVMIDADDTKSSAESYIGNIFFSR